MNLIPVINISCEKSIDQEQFEKAIRKVINQKDFILGKEVSQFENNIANYLNVKYAIGVANGTDALVLALDSVGIGEGDEVITTPYTFFATAEAIARVGAKPVFVDVLEDTYNINPSLIEGAITPRSKAILPVHIFGNPIDFNQVYDIAQRNGLSIIEDACQAIGASYYDKKIGSLGDVSCFSFFPTKNLGGFGDGGLITTNNEELAEKMIMLRSHGQRIKYQNEMLGYNSRLDEIQAAVLNVKLPYLDSWNNRRRELASKYTNAFIGIEEIVTPIETKNAQSVFHLYTMMVQDREQLMHYLQNEGIATSVYYAIPLHLQNALTYLGHQKGDFPISEKLSRHALALPLYPELSDVEQNQVIQAVLRFYRNKKKE